MLIIDRTGNDIPNLPVPEGEEEAPQEDLLKPGHLSRLLEEELGAEVASLSLGEVSDTLEQLVERLRVHRDSCPSHQLQVGAVNTAYTVAYTAL